MVFFFFFSRDLGKIEVSKNKNKGSLGIMLKMTNGDMMSIFAFSAS